MNPQRILVNPMDAFRLIQGEFGEEAAWRWVKKNRLDENEIRRCLAEEEIAYRNASAVSSMQVKP